jgi:competence protein ComEA
MNNNLSNRHEKKVGYKGKTGFFFYCALIFLSMALSACDTQSEFLYETDPPVEEVLTLDSEDSFSEKTEDPQEYIYVYVGGHVREKGIYVLEKGSRVCDAINAAGGTDRNFDMLNLNPAAELYDGEKLMVMEKEELSDEILIGPAGEGVENNETLGLHNNTVNINTASIEILKTIPGIGDVRAKAIIDHREKKGQFKSIDDIKKVSGIKDGTFEKIKDYISVD